MLSAGSVNPNLAGLSGDKGELYEDNATGEVFIYNGASWDLIATGSPGGNVFGDDYQATEQPREITTNSAAWLNVVTIDFVPAVPGVFRGAWSSEVDSNGTYIGLRLRHRSGGAGPWATLALGEITAGTLHDPHGGLFVNLGLDAEQQEFELDIQSGGPPTSVGARRTRLEIWKVRNS